MPAGPRLRPASAAPASPRFHPAEEALAGGAADLAAPVLAVGPGDALALGSGSVDLDAPAHAAGTLALASPHGPFVADPIAPVQNLLAVGFLGRNLVTVGGTSPATLACCSKVVAQVGPDPARAPEQTILSGLDGPTGATLVPERSGEILVLANPAGVYVSRAGASGRFGPARRLAGPLADQRELAATALSDGGVMVAFTAAATGLPGAQHGQVVRYAVGGRNGLPGRSRILLRLPPGHCVDALALTAHGPGATLAYVESWFDRLGYHARAYAEDTAGPAAPQPLSSPRRLAAGLALSGDRAGEQVAVWQACAPAGTACGVQAAVRSPRSGFARPVTLGPIDPGAFPAVVLLGSGAIEAAWVADGELRVDAGPTAQGGFAPPGTLPSGADASAPTLAAGADGGGALAWISGQAVQRVLVARFAPALRRSPTVRAQRRLDHRSDRRTGGGLAVP
jgi:hypothetical protein